MSGLGRRDGFTATAFLGCEVLPIRRGWPFSLAMAEVAPGLMEVVRESLLRAGVPLLSTFMRDHVGSRFGSVKWAVLPCVLPTLASLPLLLWGAGPWRFR